MTIRDWNKTKFTIKSKIEWPCPNCKSSALKIDEDRFHSDETARSKEIKELDDWEYEWLTLVFNGILKCSNCEEVISVTGNAGIEHIRYYDPNIDYLREELIEEFTPEFFHPPLHIIEIPEKCSEIVKNEIIDSFKLFWFDLSSCANKIRTSLELLLNKEKVNKTVITKKKSRRRLKLHERIVLYKKKNHEVAEFLLAIKWIGNAGSHIGSLERNDLLDAYELLEFSLNKLYNDKEPELKRMSREINTRKGTRKKNKK